MSLEKLDKKWPELDLEAIEADALLPLEEDFRFEQNRTKASIQQRSGTNELENQVLSYLPWKIHLDSGYIKDMTSDILASIDPTKVNSGKTRIYTLLCNGYKGQLGKDEMAVDPTTWGITVIKTIDHITTASFLL